MNKTWDYIIVGAGTAGCVLANRLTSDPKIRVLLLEAGGEDYHLTLRMPAGVISAVFNDKFNWKYPALPDNSRNAIEDRWSGGKALGGSSSINGMLFMRGSPCDYNRWAELGCGGWDYASVLPYFKSIEEFEGDIGDSRGSTGPLSVTFPAYRPAILGHLIEAAQCAGHEYNSDYNSGESDGVAIAQSTIRAGRRHSSARAFLTPIRSRSNLEVRTGAQISRVLFSGQKATGVAYTWRGREQKAQCRQEVILSAGAIGTPKILMHSGIGPSDMLRELGIPIVCSSPKVGTNLMEHPGVYVSADTTIPTSNSAARPQNAPKVFLDWLFRGRGPAALGTALAQVLFRSSASETAPDLQILLSPATFSIRDDGRGASLSKTDGLSLACCLLEPKTRGTVQLTSPDPRDFPVVNHTLLGEQEDIDRLVIAAREALRIIATLKDGGVVSKLNLPIDETATSEELSDYLRRSAFRGDHPSGTCAMGAATDDVLDPRLCVRGVDGLRVVDASIMPVIPKANTNASVMMIAEKASAIIRNVS